MECDLRISLLVLAMEAVGCGGGNTPPQGGENASGNDRTVKTALLESRAVSCGIAKNGTTAKPVR